MYVYLCERECECLAVGTIIIGRSEGRAIASHPRLNRDKFSDEARYGALHDGCISPYHVFRYHLCLVILSHD